MWQTSLTRGLQETLIANLSCVLNISSQDDQGVAEITLPKPYFSGYRDFVYVDEDQEFQVILASSALLVIAAEATTNLLSVSYTVSWCTNCCFPQAQQYLWIRLPLSDIFLHQMWEFSSGNPRISTS